MHPILFQIGDVAIHSYGVLSAAGFLLIAFLTIRRGRAAGLDPDKLVDMIFWTSIAAVVGARAVYIIQNPGDLTTPMEWINLRTGGLVFYGAMFTIIPVGGLMMWRHKLPFYKVMDMVAAAAPLGHAVSRLGCFFAGCCYGRPTDVPWAVIYTDDLAPAEYGVPVHPTQLYEAAYLFAIFVVVNVFYSRKRFDGQVTLLYLMLYAVLRSVNEVFRGDSTRGWFLESVLGQTVSTSQGLSLVIALVALVVFLVGARRNAGKATAA